MFRSFSKSCTQFQFSIGWFVDKDRGWSNYAKLRAFNERSHRCTPVYLKYTCMYTYIFKIGSTTISGFGNFEPRGHVEKLYIGKSIIHFQKACLSYKSTVMKICKQKYDNRKRLRSTNSHACIIMRTSIRRKCRIFFKGGTITNKLQRNSTDICSRPHLNLRLPEPLK